MKNILAIFVAVCVGVVIGAVVGKLSSDNFLGLIVASIFSSGLYLPLSGLLKH
ncbi:MAG: hypothetical protein Q8R34_00880 [bacterium]|nr:hypothetical protein [bacterium]